MRPFVTKTSNSTKACPCASFLLRMTAAVTAVIFLGGVQAQAKDSVLFQRASIFNGPESGASGGLGYGKGNGEDEERKGRGGGGRRDQQTASEVRGGKPSGLQSRSLYERAAALKDAGRCKQAIPVFRCLAARGRGYELALLRLGQCLLAFEGDGDPAEQAQEGLYWIELAANSGLADAQGDLVGRNLRGGPHNAPDYVAAATWYQLYEENPVRLNVGARPIPEGIREGLSRAVSPEQWAEAEKSAGEWSRVSLKSEPLSSEESAPCRPKSLDGKRRKQPPERVRPGTPKGNY